MIAEALESGELTGRDFGRETVLGLDFTDQTCRETEFHGARFTA